MDLTLMPERKYICCEESWCFDRLDQFIEIVATQLYWVLNRSYFILTEISLLPFKVNRN